VICRTPRHVVSLVGGLVALFGSLVPRGAILKHSAATAALFEPEARGGVKDRVRISDCRMSGTAFGTIVLHITPEEAAGGPLGPVESGDRIRLSVQQRRLDFLVAPDVLERRRASRRRPVCGWDRIVAEQVPQADEGCDLAVPRAGG
jgi:dihydroxy-acid dehydratase